MKKLLLIFTGLITPVLLFSQIDFRELSLEEACQKAKAENKLIFLDCYTTWCGPCKMMANTVFTLKEAGDYFNQRFVCLKKDMEKATGRSIGKKYGVNSYPTFLILGADGELIHKVVGASPLNEFISKIELGLNKNTLEEFEKQYKAGGLSLKDQMSYWTLLSVSGYTQEAQEVGNQLWGRLQEKDRRDTLYWPLLSSRATSLESEEFKFVLTYRDYFSEKLGTEKIGTFIYDIFMQELKLMILYQLPNRRYERITMIQTLLEDFDLPRKESLVKITELAIARKNQDFDAFLDVIEDNLKVWSDAEKDLVFEGAKLMLPERNKVYCKRLSELAFQACEWCQDELVKDNLQIIGASHRRLGHIGVYWEKSKTLESVLLQAQLEQKHVFLYCYREGQTTKLTQEKLFTQEKTGDYLNVFFVNYQINIEEGLGPWISKMYGVRTSGEMLILKPDGTLRHLVNNVTFENFIERVNETFDETKALGALRLKYEMGERSPEFMMNYLIAMQKANDSDLSQIVSELFEILSEEQRIMPEYWLLYHPQLTLSNPRIRKYVLDNYECFKESIGAEKVDPLVLNQIYADLMNPLYDMNSKITEDDVIIIEEFLKRQPIQNSVQLMGLAKMVKLYKNKNYKVKAYKKASKEVPVESIPFIELYSAIQMYAPERVEEWKDWGKEIMSILKDPRWVKWYEQFLK